MRCMRSWLLGMFAMWLALVAQTAVRADGPIVTKGSRIAIVGDSITEQKLYCKYMEAYLLACSGVPDLTVFQYGWSGETASGFANRLEADLGIFKPSIVTLCYGMNDGGYRPFDEQVGKNYETNMRNVLKKLEAVNVPKIIVGSPGAVDTFSFRPGQMMGDRPAHVAYNDNLAHLRDIDKKLAAEHKQFFANVHDAMIDAMAKAKAAYGEKYHVCGGDGFHPAPNGQLAMAYAFLKSLQLNGEIGEITIDMQGTASGSEGHKVTGSAGAATVESSRWPFCFDGDGKSPDSTRSIAPHLPFNADLNRFVLKVKNLTAAKAKVTWGEASQEFSREQLAAGINLAAEFSSTPFDGSFQKLVGAIGTKQNLETYMIKQVSTMIRQAPGELKADPEIQAALQTLIGGLMKRREKLEADSRALLVPVKHTIKVTPAA